MSTLKVNQITDLNGAEIFEPNLMTAQSASGTAVDFTDIPSWAKRITVIFSEVGFTSTDHLLVQLGTSAGIDATGYICASSTGTGFDTSTAGFMVRLNSASYAATGIMTIVQLSGNTWVSSHSCMRVTNDQASVGGGTKTLTGALTQLRITRTGTGSFDGGTINVMYE